MMNLKINGEYKELKIGISLSELIEITGFSKKGPFAVELNKKLIKQIDFEKCTLKEGDEIEIVTFVGGG